SIEGNAPIEQTFSPYHAYKQFGQEELVRMSNTDIGESKQFERDGVEMEYEVLEREGEYELSELNKDVENDIYLYLEEDIQKKMNKRVDKYVEDNKDMIKFNSTLDAATYMKSQQSNNEKKDSVLKVSEVTDHKTSGFTYLDAFSEVMGHDSTEILGRDDEHKNLDATM